MRQYYDVACLLNNKMVQQFIGTDEYSVHKKMRFPEQDFKIPIAENEAFLLSNSELRKAFQSRYEKTSKLYYRGQPSFEEILSIIGHYIQVL